MSEYGSNLSQERMREHLSLTSSRYRDICHDMEALGEYVQDSLDLDRLLGTEENEFGEIEATFSYFGLQLKNVSFALNSVASALKRRSDSLKKSSIFEMEKSMHLG